MASNKLRCLPLLFNKAMKIQSFHNYPIQKNGIFVSKYISKAQPLSGKCDTVPVATFDDVRKAKGDKNVLVIDVREPKELQETGVIPDSINIPLGEVENVLKNLPSDEFQKRYCRPKPGLDFPIIFSCRSGRRSESASNQAVQLGYKNVRNYSGGWLDWEKHM